VDVGSLKGAPRLWSLDNELGANRANNAYNRPSFRAISLLIIEHIKYIAHQ